jgi:hypothetical protein
LITLELTTTHTHPTSCSVIIVMEDAGQDQPFIETLFPNNSARGRGDMPILPPTVMEFMASIPATNYKGDKVLTGKALNKARYEMIKKELKTQKSSRFPFYSKAWGFMKCPVVASDTPTCRCNNRKAKFRIAAKTGLGFFSCTHYKPDSHPKKKFTPRSRNDTFPCTFFKWLSDVVEARCRSDAFKLAYPINKPNEAEVEDASEIIIYV